MNSGRMILGILLIVFGVSWLFNLELFHIILPLLVIWFGIKILVGKSGPKSWEKSEEGSVGQIKRVMIFSGLNKKFVSKDFTGAEFVCIFGGGEIDLSAVETKSKQVTLDVVAIFGGMKIIVPQNWSVNSEGVGIVGGFNNSTKSPVSAKVEATAEGVAIIGGVDIVNPA